MNYSCRVNSKILEELTVSSETSSNGKEVSPQLTEEQRETSVSSGWGSWGSSWLSKAANTVASSAHSLASNTEIGISSLVNSVESSFGIPTPESMASRDVVDKKEDCVSEAAVNLKELAQKLKEEQNIVPQVDNDCIPKDTTGLPGDNIESKEQNESSGFISSYGISLTNKLVSGGLDTLENLGKKTIGLISEGDPGLRNKRAFVQEQIDIITKEKVTDEEIDADTPTLTTFHLEFEQLQGYVYLEALEILSNECESKQHLKMHSVSTRQQEGGATQGIEEITEEMFEITFESETASSELVDLLPSCKGLVSLERIQQTVGEIGVCDESFEKIELSRDTLLPQLNSVMRLIAKLSSQYIQVVRKVSELCLSQQVPLKETISHSKELALIAYKHIDMITTRIALIEVSDDVIGNKFILDMNSGVSYIQDSFNLLRSILKSASSS